MSKRKIVHASILSGFALTTLCLLSAAITAQIPAPANQTNQRSIAAGYRLNLAFAAQKGPESATSSVRPVKGIDVVVMKNPGNSAVRTIATDKDGNANFGTLEAGSYSVKFVRASQAPIPGGLDRLPSAKESGEEIKEFEIVIKGAKGGPRSGVWNLEKGTFRAPEQSTAKATDAHSIGFESDGHAPIIFNTSISKSRSNIKTNAKTGSPNSPDARIRTVCVAD